MRTIEPRVIWLRLTRASRVKRSETCDSSLRKPTLDGMQVLAESGGNLADSLTLRAQISRLLPVSVHCAFVEAAGTWGNNIASGRQRTSKGPAKDQQRTSKRKKRLESFYLL